MRQVVLCAAMLLTACQSAPSPQTSIAYGYAGVTAALNTLAQATTSGLLTSAEATQADQAILAAKAALDAANAPGATSTTASIAAATSALANISAYLTCKQQKGPACRL